MTQPVTRWYVSGAASQWRRHWADESEWIVFNEASGDLHLVNAEAIAVLDRLAAGQASIEDLCAALDTASADAIRQVVSRLDSLGLVSPLQP